MKEKVKAPELRFPGFTNDWEERKLGDIFVYKQGQQVPVENQFTKRGKNRHRFIRIVDLTTNNEAPRYIEYSGDNIISSTDLFMIRYGQPGVIGYGYEGVIANNLFKLIPKIETYNLFFKYILDSMYPKIQSLSSSTTMPAISFKSLDVLAVRYPDKKEQEKIGSFFAQLDNTIALHQRKLDLLKEQKKGYLQKMFPKNGAKVPELRFAGFADDWEERKLGEVATFLNGRAYKQDELLDSGKYKVLRVGNFYTNDSWYYSNMELGDKYYVDKGDLVYTWSATFGPHIWSGEKVIYHYHIWKVELSKFLDRNFTLQLLEADKARLLSSTNGSTMIHVTKGDMESKIVSIPNIDEQKQIGSFFKQLDNTIALHQRKLDLLKEQKKGFLQKMFV